MIESSEYSFAKDIFSQDSGAEISWKEGGVLTAKRTGPGNESVDAFILTYRFFIQKRDGISFADIAEIYESINLSSSLKAEFRGVYNSLNAYFEEKTSFVFNKKQLTNKELMQIFIYGGKAHGGVKSKNRDKKQMYNYLSSLPIFPFVENQFIVIMANVVKVIYYMKKLNIKALEEMG